MRRGGKHRAFLCYEPADDIELLGFFDIFILASYDFSSYKSKAEQSERTFSYIELDAGRIELLQKRLEVLSGVYAARDLVNTPSNDKYPEKFVQMLQSHEWTRTKLTILDRDELERQGFGLLLAVAAGSSKSPYVAIMERMIDPTLPTIAIAGKGVTFDTGGVQIKPEDMEDMKMDMGGAAAAIGAMMGLDALETLPWNVIVAVGLAENMPDGNAYRPNDIYRSYTGKTVEIDHTDAEGRLVLADVVGYLEANCAPKSIVSIATLTGACMRALGYEYAGIFGNDERIIQAMIDLSDETMEAYCRLPFDHRVLRACKGENADLRSLNRKYLTGPSIGAAFIASFVERARFTHMDIAGPAFRPEARGIFPKEGTGFGALSLYELLRR